MTIELDVKEKFAEERKAAKLKLEGDVAKVKSQIKVKKEWYQRMPNGDIRKYVVKTNGNKFSKKIGNVYKTPSLAKLVEEK